MKILTHLSMEESLSGKIIALEEGFARVWLHTSEIMCADEKGLIHGGFIFSAADYAAMAAVNDPNVVLGAATTRFIAPVKKGESIVFEAKVVNSKGKKVTVEVSGFCRDKKVFEGNFTTFVLKHHILE